MLGKRCFRGLVRAGALLTAEPAPSHRPSIAHTLHSPLQLGTRLSQPRQELLHLTWWPLLHCTWPSQLDRKKKRRGGGSQGCVKGWARLGGGIHSGQPGQNRLGYQTEEEEGPTATTQDEGVPVCHQGWLEEVQTSHSPLPLLHSLLVREQGPSRTQHLQNAAKRQQWWGRGRETRPD